MASDVFEKFCMGLVLFERSKFGGEWLKRAKEKTSARSYRSGYSTAGPMIAPWKLRAAPFWFVTETVMN